MTPSTTSSPAPVPDGSGPRPRDLAELLALLAPDARRLALTHPFWASDSLHSYERLEFLGDSVLGVIVTEALMQQHPDRLEGDLTWMRQAVVSRDACAVVADACGLPEAMVDAAPRSRRADARQLADHRNVKAALAESVIGAAWLDVGEAPTRSAVLGAFAEPLAHAHERIRDPKTKLQERLQGAGQPGVRYEITGREGSPHDATFHARVLQGDREMGVGSGRSKQAAERAAAEAALDSLGEEA
ncbi:MAG: ribonuclease III [Acidobacteria bacterium]|nr:ribonuclease III [Acidobacteriota bacterium]